MPVLKIAEIITPLQPHQQRLVEKMRDPNTPGQIAAWGLGSGKSLGAIAVADDLGKPADLVAPAALGGNFRKEIAKHTPEESRPDIAVHGLENMARKGGAPLKRELLILDEAHRIRNSGKARQAIQNSPAHKKLLLTGSLLYNHPADLAGPLNTVAGEGTVPASPQDFSKRYVRNRTIEPGWLDKMRGATPGNVEELDPTHAPELRSLLHKYVDYHPGSSEGFPERTDETIRVPMTQKQRAIYDGIIGKAPSWVRAKIRSGLPPSKAESSDLNQFLAAGRQVSNSTAPYETEGEPDEPKIRAAAQYLKKYLADNPNARAMVYSNYTESGLDRYKSYLDPKETPFGEFTGQQGSEERDQHVRDYNAGKLRALLVSGAGGEGLDLKGTRLMQILDPHWNSERINQAVGRGIRYKSHEDLPEAERKVLVQKYLATMPRSGISEKMRLADPGNSPDEYLSSLSDRKEKLLSQFRELYQS